MCEAFKAISVELRRRCVVDGAFIDSKGNISPIAMVVFAPLQVANDG